MTTLIIKLANRADQKSLISNFELHLAVSSSIAALITKMKRPKVTIVTGKVRIFTIEPNTALIRPKRSATQR